jgi:hypothetical protein
MRSRFRGPEILLAAQLVLAAGCSRVAPIRPYDQRTFADADSGSLLILGVAEGDEKIGRPVSSSLFQTELQLHRVTVQIENVLRGNIPEHNITLYYFAFEHLNTGHPPLIFGKAPSRRLISVRKDGAVYRTAIDGWNCAPRVVTGAHPGYTPGPNASLAEIDIDLNMNRGDGPVDDEQFAIEIETLTHSGGDEALYAARLRHLVLTESGKVKSTACRELARYSDGDIDQSLRERILVSIKTAGCKCRGNGSVVCQ